MTIGKQHGHSSGGKLSPTYISWHNMKQRCRDPGDTSYARYGGRGITFCERWLDFNNFLQDMGERPDGLTLDRLDNDGNYEPSNCRWATRKQQKPRRATCFAGHALDPKNTYVTPDGKRSCITCRNAASARYAARVKAGLALLDFQSE